MELKENLFQLTDFHMKVIFAIAEGDAELTEATNLLEQAMCVVVRDADFILADHHLRRVHAFGKGRIELDLHLHFLTEFALLKDKI